MRLILISSSASDRPLFERLAALAQLDFQHFTQTGAAVDDLARDPSAVVLFDANTPSAYGSFEAGVADKLGIYSALVNPNWYIAFGSRPFQAQKHLHSSQILGSYIQRSGPIHEPLFSKVLSMIASDKAFELESFIKPQTELESVELAKSADRSACLASLQDLLGRMQVSSRISTCILSGCDELLLNAIYDAPSDELGKPIHQSTPRTSSLTFEEKSKILLRIAYIEDSNTLALSVIDRHGSLDRGKVFASLGKDFRLEEFRSRTTQVGAGIGLPESLRRASGSHISIEPGLKTEVTLFYHLSKSFREFREESRFFSSYVLAMN